MTQCQMLQHSIDFHLAAQIRFRQQQAIGKGHLFGGFIDTGLLTLGLQLGQQVLGIANTQDGVQTIILLHEWIQEECGSNPEKIFKKRDAQSNEAVRCIVLH